MFKEGDLVAYVYCPEYDICPHLAKRLEKDQGVIVERMPRSFLVKWEKNERRSMYPKELVHSSVKDRIINRVMGIEHV